MNYKSLNKQFRLLSNTIATLILFTLTGCKLSFTTDVKNFLRENTEYAAVIGYSTNIQNLGSAYISEEHPDYYCIPSTQDLVITYELRNPQNYKFKLNESMILDFTNKKLFINAFGNLADPSSITIYQGTENENKENYQNFYITVTIPKDFLSASEYGLTYDDKNMDHTKAHDITPIIQLKHPEHGIDFGKYGNQKKPLNDELHIISNSAPPTIYGPTVYQKPISGNESYSNYMLVFNMPSASVLNDNHKDVNRLSIVTSGDGTTTNGARTYEFDLTIKDDGTLTAAPTANSYKNTKIYSGNPTDGKDNAYDSTIVPTGAAFDMRGQPFYLLTDHIASSKDIIYTMTLKDAWGLKTSVQANARSVRLADFFVTHEFSDNETAKQQLLKEEFIVPQDESSSYATVNFVPAFNTYWFIDAEKNIQNRYSYAKLVSVDASGEEIIKYYSPDAKEIEGVECEIISEFFNFDEDGNLNLDDFWKENGYVSVKSSASGKYISVKSALDNKLLSIQTANTSNSSIIYEVYQGKDETGNALLNGTYDCTKSVAASIPKAEAYKTETGEEITILNHSESDVMEKGHYLPLQLPSGNVFVRVYSHLKGFADTLPREFKIKVLRTISFVANENPENGGNDHNTGSENAPFASINRALNLLSDPSDKKNTIYLKSNITESIKIPAKDEEIFDEDGISNILLDDMNVSITSKNIASSESYTITVAEDNKTILDIPANAKITVKDVNLAGSKYLDLENGADTTISVGENSIVIFENSIIRNCNLNIAAGAKVYLNDVQFEKGIINEEACASVILGGNTHIKAEKDNNGNPSGECALIRLEEKGIVQLGSDDTETPSRKYTARDLIFITTKEPKPNLNIAILECEDPSATLEESYPDIYEDIIAAINPYQIFALAASGGSYYIHYMNEVGNPNFGKGIIRIPAAYVNLPVVGGFEIALNGINQNNLWIYENSTKQQETEITVSFIRNKFDYSNYDEISGKKLEFKLEDDVIASVKNSNTIKIPTGYPEGKYKLTVYFTFNGISYSETFNLYIKEAE